MLCCLASLAQYVLWRVVRPILAITRDSHGLAEGGMGKIARAVKTEAASIIQVTEGTGQISTLVQANPLILESTKLKV